MPQLTGPEQMGLVNLIADHLTDPAQLDRALLFAGLGNLSRYSSKGTLDAMTSDVVRELSAQYRIPEFVEAVLNGDFLNGHCPPIEDWLSKNRTELLRRREHPTINEKVRRLAATSRVFWLCVALAIFGVGWLGLYLANPWERPPLELPAQSFTLQQSIAPLTSIANSRPTRGAEELQTYASELVDKGEYGVVLITKPIEQTRTNPTITVKGIDEDASHLDDPDGTVEICCLPPDRDRESTARWSPRLKLNGGIAVDGYNGDIAGTVVVVLYHRKEPRQSPPRFTVSLK